jgi:hypothetical protein
MRKIFSFLLAALLAPLTFAQNAPISAGGVPSTLNPSAIGPAANGICIVDGFVHKNIAACGTYLGTTLGLNGGIIYSNLPEDVTTDPWPANFTPQLHLGTGLASSTCNTTHLNCWVLEVPIPLLPGSTIEGSGRVQGTTQSEGTTITYGTSFPPPLGVPTEGTITTASTGGSLSNGTYYIGVRTVNNLESNAGKAKIPGPSASTTLTAVTLNAGTTTQTITVPIPSAVGNSPFQAQDFEVCEAASATADCLEQIPGSGLTCTTGVVDTVNGCKMSGGTSAVIGSIQTGTFAFELVDLSNPMFILGPGSTTTFDIQLRDFTLDCQSGGTNAPNVALWNFSGNEQSGAGNGSVTMQGACGGYSAGASGTTGGSATAFSGAYYYSESLTQNSAIEHVYFGNGPSAGTFYAGIFDGRANGTGTASGSARLVHDVTAVTKAGASVPAVFLVTGLRARVHFDDVHMESSTSGGDGIQCTDGAYCLATGIDGAPSTTGNLVHLTSTGGSLTGVGLCPQGSNGPTAARCSSSAVAFQDDTVTKTWSGYQGLVQSGTAAIFSGFASGTDTGAANAYVVANLFPPMTSYTYGAAACFTATHANTTTNPTVNFNGLGTKTIAKWGEANLSTSGDIGTATGSCMYYDGTDFILLNPQSKTGTGSQVAANAPTITTSLTVTGPVWGQSSSMLTTPTSISTTAFTTTGIVLPTVPISTTQHGYCSIGWSQSTAVSTVTFGLGMNNAPTDLWVLPPTTWNGTTNTVGSATTIANTTTTAVTAALTPAATATEYRATLDFTIETGATNTVALTLYAESGSTSDAAVISAGSACGWLP